MAGLLDPRIMALLPPWPMEDRRAVVPFLHWWGRESQAYEARSVGPIPRCVEPGLLQRILTLADLNTEMARRRTERVASVIRFEIRR